MSKESFVYFKLMGGLGNQIFEYAAAFGVAKLNNAKIYIQNTLENHHNTKGQNYIQKLFLDASECLDIPGESIEFSHKDFAPWNPKDIQVPCRLMGHFQFYPAIEPYMPELIEGLSKALGVSERKNEVFIHVRRGDYVEKSNTHFLQGQEYYLSSYYHLIHTLKKIPEKVILFSDDIEWCKQQEWLRIIPNIVFYEEEDEIKTLKRMAECGGGAIIANSTFSWWGAHLSKSSYVYYPKKWINIQVYDLFPKNWIQVG